MLASINNASHWLQNLAFVESLEASSKHAGDYGLVRGVLAAALYPQVGQILHKRNKHAPPKLMTAAPEQVLKHNAFILGLLISTENALMTVPSQ